MKRSNEFVVATLLGIMILSASVAAQSLIDQWRKGLSGAKLTAYSGSVISSNSTLTVVNFCRNGRYTYSREGSWSVPGSAGGASNNQISGRWDIQQNGSQIVVSYMADDGRSGTLPIFLQNDGKVNLYGTAFSVQKDGAGC